MRTRRRERHSERAILILRHKTLTPIYNKACHVAAATPAIIASLYILTRAGRMPHLMRVFLLWRSNGNSPQHLRPMGNKHSINSTTFLLPSPCKTPKIATMAEIVPKAKSLCQRCGQIFRDPCLHGTQHHYYSIQELERAAFEKCYICRVLWKAFSEKQPSNVIVNPVVSTTPISTYELRHKVTYAKDISEISFTVDKNDALKGGRVFRFTLQGVNGELKTRSSIAKRILILYREV